MKGLRRSWVFGVAGLAACVAPTTLDTGALEGQGSQTQPIIGGATTTEHPYLVAVRVGGLLCSGTLIAPNLVLTARHCVDAYEQSLTVTGICGNSENTLDCAGGDEFTTAHGPDTSFWVSTSPTIASGVHNVQQIVRTPATVMCGNDLALLILSDKIAPSEALPAAPLVHPLTDHARFGTEFVAIGYGMTDPMLWCGGSDSGTRRLRQHVDMLCIPDDPLLPCEVDGALYDHPILPSWQRMTAKDWLGAQVGCNGDSGGGAFDQARFDRGERLLIGVFSRVGRGAEQCTYSIYVRVDLWADFIQTTARDAAGLGGYAVPEWAVDCVASPAGTPCDDQDECTTADACLAGTCVGSPLTCSAADECHSDGTCDASSGACTSPAVDDGTACSAGACVAGICEPATQDDGQPAGGGDDGSGGDGDVDGAGDDDGADDSDAGDVMDAGDLGEGSESNDADAPDLSHDVAGAGCAGYPGSAPSSAWAAIVLLAAMARASRRRER